MKEFVTAAEEVVDEEEGLDSGVLEFAIDGFEVKAYKPGSGQFALLMASTGRHSNVAEKTAGAINFFMSVLDDEAYNHVVSRLLDRKDPFGIEQVSEIMEWMIEEWSARPTQSSSGSSPSRKPAGRKSTPRTLAST